jgi:hypothetical protein
MVMNNEVKPWINPMFSELNRLQYAVEHIGGLEAGLSLLSEQALKLEKQRNKLLESLKDVIGSHFAPNDCYSTGPMTGDPVYDLVRCPSCCGLALIEEIETSASHQQPSNNAAANE